MILDFFNLQPSTYIPFPIYNSPLLFAEGIIMEVNGITLSYNERFIIMSWTSINTLPKILNSLEFFLQPMQPCMDVSFGYTNRTKSKGFNLTTEGLVDIFTRHTPEVLCSVRLEYPDIDIAKSARPLWFEYTQTYMGEMHPDYVTLLKKMNLPIKPEPTPLYIEAMEKSIKSVVLNRR